MSDQAIEQEIQAKGLTAPRITPADVEANIVREHYFTAEEGVRGATKAIRIYEPDPLALLTFCVLVLKNGFTVTGESACASPKNFDAEIGRKIARENAKQKIWAFMGYELKSKLQQAEDFPLGQACDLAGEEGVRIMSVEQTPITERMTNMDFSFALRVLKTGGKVSRSGWNGKGMWLELQTPDAMSKMTLPYVYLNYPSDAINTPNARVPWLASQTDLLANDWGVVE